MSYQVKQSSTANPLEFIMIDSIGHLVGATGLTPTVTISKNGGSFASPAGAVTEIAYGWYKVAGNATDSDTAGPLVLHATAVGADAQDVVFIVVANLTADVVALLPAALVGGRMDSSVGAVASGVIAAASFAANALDAVWSTATRVLTAATNLTTALATPTNITAGTITTVTNLTNAPTSGDLTATMKTSVTTAATAATPTAAAVTGAVGSVTGNVGGNVAGSVASVVAGVTLAASAVQAIWDALTSALTTVGSVGKLIVTNLDVLVSSRTKPADTQAAVTLVTTTTNLTNAPTVGDLTAAMKSSVTAAAPTVAQIQSGLSTLTAAGVRTAVGLASANLDTQVAALQADTDDIQARLPAALTVGGNLKADSLAIGGDTTAATNLAGFYDAAITLGSITGAAPTPSGISDSTKSATDDFYKGCVLVFRSGTLAGIPRKITAYAGATGTFTFATAFPVAPAQNDTFAILGRIE